MIFDLPESTLNRYRSFSGQQLKNILDQIYANPKLVDSFYEEDTESHIHLKFNSFLKYLYDLGGNLVMWNLNDHDLQDIREILMRP